MRVLRVKGRTDERHSRAGGNPVPMHMHKLIEALDSRLRGNDDVFDISYDRSS